MNRWVGLALFVTLAGLVTTLYFLRPPANLQVTVHVENADLGIPGVSKVYKAILTNHGARPALVLRCNFITDAMDRETMLAEALQRWDPRANAWQNITIDTEANFCKPAPLSIIQGDSVQRLLRPGASLETEEEATAGRDAFHKGDRARFVVFLGRPGDFSHSLATESFTLDEESTSDVDLKVKH